MKAKKPRQKASDFAVECYVGNSFLQVLVETKSRDKNEEILELSLSFLCWLTYFLSTQNILTATPFCQKNTLFQVYGLVCLF